ncbi:MAG: glutathione synthase [Gammaproteobacteria bacterium]|nr:glutathione synthase [Gammaproteobacteria bacterium]MDH5593694.1 glutathione synthase [Gammaproteobacteria bacterium]
MIKLGVIMDPIESINIKKDSTFAMLLAAQARGWKLFYMTQNDLSYQNNTVTAHYRELSVTDDPQQWFELGKQHSFPLHELDVVLMRKDPPFDMEYIYTTYLLEQAEAKGTLIVNKPQALRDANEKMFTLCFSDLTPPTLVSREAEDIREFLNEQQEIILKPLGGMGGESIFHVTQNDLNIAVIIETLTAHGTRYAMCQKFIPEIKSGDKRILMIDGESVPYALARIPAEGELRGNLAAGGKGVGIELSENDQRICKALAPVLREKGILFAGIDVIGDYLTEINITSPTCIRELDAIFGLDIGGQLMDVIEKKLNH